MLIFFFLNFISWVLRNSQHARKKNIQWVNLLNNVQNVSCKFLPKSRNKNTWKCVLFKVIDSLMRMFWNSLKQLPIFSLYFYTEECKTVFLRDILCSLNYVFSILTFQTDLMWQKTFNILCTPRFKCFNCFRISKRL